ncbi:Maf1-domain-containing protein [Dichomitus squalens]|uniref:Repressor of RNA polymerase III transcription MAF1 n=1 Tax=Dichomitus squalens TaxID=114155 RepID=A0A4Q9NY67_9APHY|nr:Maf1-domain-containing protein [Dichomitus squalens]TBU63035.1 Maf1-domain-containing protein [Dichomitus squalens]
MKFIERNELSTLARALTHEGPECSVHTRIELYSCKNIKRDKKLFRDLEHAYADEVSHSPPLPSDMAVDPQGEMTPFGPMTEPHSRKTLYLLIATLNVAFPDHEFSDVRPYHFNREESGAAVLNALSTTLVSPHRSGLPSSRTYSSYPPSSADFFPRSVPTSSSPLDFYVKPSPRAPSRAQSGTHPTVYNTLNREISLAECEVYSYTPDPEFDPHANDTDDEDELASADDDGAPSSDDDIQFQFDDYDVDEAPARRRNTGSTDESDREAPAGGRFRRRGALLWSSHWFFLNRKLKRILFISIWARSRGIAAWMDQGADVHVAYGSPDKVSGERFLGWEGAVGAGARAMGLSVSANL